MSLGNEDSVMVAWEVGFVLVFISLLGLILVGVDKLIQSMEPEWRDRHGYQPATTQAPGSTDQG